jgi:hypothetical protein
MPTQHPGSRLSLLDSTGLGKLHNQSDRGAHARFLAGSQLSAKFVEKPTGVNRVLVGRTHCDISARLFTTEFTWYILAKSSRSHWRQPSLHSSQLESLLAVLASPQSWRAKLSQSQRLMTALKHGSGLPNGMAATGRRNCMQNRSPDQRRAS